MSLFTCKLLKPLAVRLVMLLYDVLWSQYDLIFGSTIFLALKTTQDAWIYKFKDTLNNKNNYVRIIMHPVISEKFFNKFMLNFLISLPNFKKIIKFELL